jgi:hypothetical protein
MRRATGAVAVAEAFAEEEDELLTVVEALTVDEELARELEEGTEETEEETEEEATEELIEEEEEEELVDELIDGVIDELVDVRLAVTTVMRVVMVVEVARVVVWLTVTVEATVFWLTCIAQAEEMTVAGYLVKTAGVEISRFSGAAVEFASVSSESMDSMGRYQVTFLLES